MVMDASRLCPCRGSCQGLSQGCAGSTGSCREGSDRLALLLSLACSEKTLYSYICQDFFPRRQGSQTSSWEGGGCDFSMALARVAQR